MVELQFWKNNVRSVNSKTVSDLAVLSDPSYLHETKISSAVVLSGF